MESVVETFREKTMKMFDDEVIDQPITLGQFIDLLEMNNNHMLSQISEIISRVHMASSRRTTKTTKKKGTSPPTRPAWWKNAYITGDNRKEILEVLEDHSDFIKSIENSFDNEKDRNDKGKIATELYNKRLKYKELLKSPPGKLYALFESDKQKLIANNESSVQADYTNSINSGNADAVAKDLDDPGLIISNDIFCEDINF